MSEPLSFKLRSGAVIVVGSPEWEELEAKTADRKEAQPEPAGTISDAEAAAWLWGELDQRVLFNHLTRKWHIYDPASGLWKEDRVTEVQRIVEDKARQAIRTVAFVSKSDTNLKLYQRLLSNRNLEAALVALARYPEYRTDGSDMDADPYLLGCANGIVDLRTSELLPPDPTRRVSRSTKLPYQRKAFTEASAAAGAERTLLFLAEIASGDTDLAKFYLRFFGYSLLGHTRAHKFLIMAGKLGRNGKGALKRLMLKVFGDYADEVDRGLYSVTKWGHSSAGPRADLMQLRGMRLAFLTEPEGSFDTNLLKAHSGGDPINARALNSNAQVSWEPSHSIVFSVNEAPKVSEVGSAVRDRILVADFNERFTGAKQDLNLDDRLASEAESVLWLLIQHARLWHEGETPDEALPLPQRVIEASAAYMTSNDPSGGFVEDGAVVGEDARSKPSDLYADYIAWHGDRWEGDRDHPALSAVEFGMYIGSLFGKHGRPPMWKGIRGKTSSELATTA